MTEKNTAVGYREPRDRKRVRGPPGLEAAKSRQVFPVDFCISGVL